MLLITRESGIDHYYQTGPQCVVVRTMTRHIPIVVGVGDVVNRSKKVEDAIEPLELILKAIRNAVEDTGLSGSAASQLQSQIDSLDVVKTWVSNLTPSKIFSRQLLMSR